MWNGSEDGSYQSVDLFSLWNCSEGESHHSDDLFSFYAPPAKGILP